MSKVVVSIIGLDSPDVMHTVAGTLSELSCNIEEVSQTILKNQVAAIFIATLPDALTSVALERELNNRITLRGLPLSVTIRPFEAGNIHLDVETEPFVVTVDGPDRFNIIASLTRMFADQRVGIENLKAIRPEDAPDTCLLVLEIALPLNIDRGAFMQTLNVRAADLGLRISMQHRDIFEAVHRVSTL